MSQPDILTDKKERSDFYIALGVILLAGAMLYYSTLGDQVDLELGDNLVTKISEEIPETAPIYESDIVEEVEIIDPKHGYHSDQASEVIQPEIETHAPVDIEEIQR